MPIIIRPKLFCTSRIIIVNTHWYGMVMVMLGYYMKLVGQTCGYVKVIYVILRSKSQQFYHSYKKSAKYTDPQNESFGFLFHLKLINYQFSYTRPVSCLFEQMGISIFAFVYK